MLTFIPGPSIKGFRFQRIPGMIGKLRIHFDAKHKNPNNKKKLHEEYRTFWRRISTIVILIFSFLSFFNTDLKYLYRKTKMALKIYSSIYFFIVQKG